MPIAAAKKHGDNLGAFTLIELLVVIAVIAILAAIITPVLNKAQQSTKRVVCMDNLRQFALADTIYCNENQRLPPTSDSVPSSITVAQLTQMAQILNVSVPPGPASAWPKRAYQPKWINCPLAVESGYAEGLTLGGGLYTGYVYVGGIEKSAMITSGLATLVNPGQAADYRETRRGVLWADTLDEFITTDPRRFEFFHVLQQKAYPDFLFEASDLEGINRAWSDGSVDWTGGNRFNLTGDGSPDLRIKHILGNYYF
jgi:prepilin-type N-terminal cleavage/methylation domain-containing protein